MQFAIQHRPLLARSETKQQINSELTPNPSQDLEVSGCKPEHEDLWL